MGKKADFISPISIDLGAKNTGVYFAHYKAGTSLNDFSKDESNRQGKVYDLDKNSYTLLMANRTANRHQRRGHDRRQLVKRLFKLIWTKHFKLDWNEDIQKVVGFLFNRRGFSFVQEEFDLEVLRRFPQEIFDELPEKVKKECEGIGDDNPHPDEYDLSYCLQSWLENDKAEEKLKTMLSHFEVEYSSTVTKKDKKGRDTTLWKFNGKKPKITPNNFSLEKANDDDLFDIPEDEESKDQWISAHIIHFIFAIQKSLNEIQSGGRHRTKYFKEVKEVLSDTNSSHKYIKDFATKLKQKNFEPLNVNSLTNLIGHLSNFELKPLRKYFNKVDHKDGDKWEEKKLTKVYEHWILNQWRVNPEKNKKKKSGGEYDYEKLKQKIKQKSGSIIDFYLEYCPNWTVPPYQDNNNRRPPKCQSLILNPTFLDKKYPKWKNWLTSVKETCQDYLDDFEEQLKNLKSGKNKSYFSHPMKGELVADSGKRTTADLDARVLQFIFDRAKKNDPLKLNEIYSIAKKIKQLKRDKEGCIEQKEKLEEQQEKLEKVLKESNLPDELNTKPNFDRDDIFEEGSLLHLACKYYKLRQKARDGRIFIHPEYHKVGGIGYKNTGRFDSQNHLLTYCNHKPRQKRYQVLKDLAAVLQVSSEHLKKHVTDKEGKTIENKLFYWLDSIKGLKTNCATAAKEQKNRRGSLKSDVATVFSFLKYNDSPQKQKDIKQVLNKSKINEAFKLYNFCVRAKNILLELTKDIYDRTKQESFNQDLDKNPATAIYLLAQINNVAFKERSGNAKTCTVCSADNSMRMTTFDDFVKAQRLPAISTRLIDGAVMRMARIIGRRIAQDKWNEIEEDLKEGKKVCVPIVTESNSFEFEPALNELKNKKKKQEGSNAGLFDKKEERIKTSSQGICPYAGDKIGEKGDLDHIIPRASEYGTLNDEANLIYASKEGNRTIKGDTEYCLNDLNDTYKRKLFGDKTDEQITEWIKEQIGNGEGENFKFGQYKSFINLSPDHQTAFRHALFLIGDPLREKIIKAIDNRTRTFVNGTQRYFAEVVANSLYKKAKQLGYENLLSFDYFGVEASYNSAGDSTSDLRKSFNEANDDIISKFSKEGGQKPYSHLIDAQLAFCIALNKHKNEGSFKLKIDDNIQLEPLDKTTGELPATMFDKINIKEDSKYFSEIDLERKKPYDKDFASHRSFTRDTYYSNRYFPILLKKEGNKVNVKIGFDWDNSSKFPEKRSERILIGKASILQFCDKTDKLTYDKLNNLDQLYEELTSIKHFKLQVKKYNYLYLNINRSKFHEQLFKYKNTSIYKTQDEKLGNNIEFVYDKLRYCTEKKTISSSKDIFSVLSKIDKHFKKNGITLPSKHEWEKLNKAWKQESNSTTTQEQNEEEHFQKFLNKHFMEKHSHPHKKVRKVFSLPVLTGEGRIFLRRKSWTGKYTLQLVNDSDSRKVDNKPGIPIRMADGSRASRLANWATSHNIVKPDDKIYTEAQLNEEYEGWEDIDTSAWYRVKKNEFTDNWPKDIKNIFL